MRRSLLSGYSSNRAARTARPERQRREKKEEYYHARTSRPGSCLCSKSSSHWVSTREGVCRIVTTNFDRGFELSVPPGTAIDPEGWRLFSWIGAGRVGSGRASIELRRPPPFCVLRGQQAAVSRRACRELQRTQEKPVTKDPLPTTIGYKDEGLISDSEVDAKSLTPV